MGAMNRRDFLKSAAAGAAFSTFAVGTSGREVLGANDRINVAVAGINGRGQSHMRAFSGMDNVQVTHLVDPDSRLFDSRKSKVEDWGGNSPKCVQDVRRVLDDDSVDVVSIATCNHWHSLMTVWACQAGKDVYVEKPLSHNVFEGRKAVEAARKYDRVVQHGTQSRSSAGQAKEIAAVKSGTYGELTVAKGYCCKPRWSIGFADQQAPPSGLDYNLWLGPAPWQEYHDNLVHYNWHWFWDTGNGEIGNHAPHRLDMCRWAMDETLPEKVWSLGGRLGYYDQAETPNMMMAVYDYGDRLLVMEVRGLVGNDTGFGRKITCEYYTDEGMIKEGRFYPDNGGDPQPLEGVDPADVVQNPGGNFFGNFIDALRNRDRSHLNAEVEEGHYSSSLAHLANISYNLGERVSFDQKPEMDHELVEKSYQAITNNLTEGVGVDLDDISYQMGTPLRFATDQEKFVGENAEDANLLLRRAYRHPFVVPEKV